MVTTRGHLPLWKRIAWIHFRPALHLQRVVAQDRWVLLLVALEGLGLLAFNEPIGKDVRYRSLAEACVFLVLPVIFLPFYYARGRALYWAGGILGGKATPREVRTVQAWAGAPLILPGLGLLALRLLDFRLQVGAASGFEQVLRDLAQFFEPLLRVYFWIALVLGVIAEHRCLALVQRFSHWRAVLSELLAPVLAVVVVGGGIYLGWEFHQLIG
jgi:hypothetical protein